MPPKPRKVRADQLAVEQGLAPDVARAQALILAGELVADDHAVAKAGQLVPATAALRLKSERLSYVSRGALKLEAALDAAKLDVTGLVCADLGASTGGFTDLLLQRGAARVHAVDVGYGILHEKLRRDGRVVIHDRVNARDATPALLGERVDLVTLDLSFISLTQVLPAAAGLLQPGGALVALVKPQFEAPREDVGEGGVVRSPAAREAAVARVEAALGGLGFALVARAQSPIRGPAGNVEICVVARRNA